MGGGRWDSDAYMSARSVRAKTGTKDFDYDHKVRTGKAKGVHTSLDPKAVAGPASPFAGQNIRESRDSDEHPESLPIAFFFDVTGSMGSIPQVLQSKLANLMDVIIAKAGVKHPQVLVGAVGDATCDTYPFQVGQFESDNRFDEQLRAIILEGNGGGQEHESYGLAFRFAADHTATDSFEKRGKKGYLFTMGDELPWPTITRQQLQDIFGVAVEKDESIEDLITRASEKWHLFHLFVNDSPSYGRTGSRPVVGEGMRRKWRELIGERLVVVDDSKLVCEVAAGLIHSMETASDLDTVLTDIGVTGHDRATVKNALVPVLKSGLPSHVAQGGVPSGHGTAGGAVGRV